MRSFLASLFIPENHEKQIQNFFADEGKAGAMLDEKIIADIVEQTREAFPPSAANSQEAEDFALRLLWKTVASSRIRLSATQIETLRNEIVEQFRKAMESAAFPESDISTDANMSGKAMSGKAHVKRETFRTDAIASVVQSAFETTFDGTESRVNSVARRARSLVDALIAGQGFNHPDTERARQIAEEEIHRQLEILKWGSVSNSTE